jgi:glucuronyl/N-acetylglucosaminyl transferase EXT1
MTTDPREACVLWVNARTACGNLQKINRLPHWDGGLNHLVFENTDFGITAAFRNKHLGRAAIAQGHSSLENYAHGVDVAIPLRSSGVALELDQALGHVLPWRRKWLLTFKGTTTHDVRSRLAIYHDEPSRVVISVYPNPHRCTSRGYAMNSDVRQVTPLPEAPLANAACCARMHVLHASYGFADLMNTTFGLVPPGRSPASYRLTEVLAAGCIPVFVGLEYAILPFSEVIPWSEFSFFAPADVDWHRGLLPMLRELEADRERLRRMQQAARKAYASYFTPMRPIAGKYAHVRRTVVDIFRQRFEYQLSVR